MLFSKAQFSLIGNTIAMRFKLMSLRTKVLFAAVICLVIGVMLATMPGSAATPSSGTLTDVSGPLTYTAGPFFVANATNNVNSNGEPTCSPAQAFPCDDYTLTVALTDTTKRVRVRVGWDVSSADFDLYVYQGATLVTSSASSSDPEEVLLPATPGVYTIRTVPFAPAGQSYNGTISLEDIPVTPPPPPPSSGTPRFQIYNPPTAYNGGEPSIGSNWQTGNAMYLASFDALRIGFDDCSSPAKDTWTNTNVPAAASLDPIMFTDHTRAPGDTTPNRTLVSQLTGQDSITFTTDDDGATYLPSQGGGIPSGVDHQTIGAGPYNESSTPAPPPHPTYPNAVYYCSQEAATAFCARSDNGGTTFGPGVPIYNLTTCTGIHGHVKVAPDGSVYVPNRSCGGKAAAVLSKDNGITWTVNPIPTSSTTGFLVDPSIGIGTNTVGKKSGQKSNTIYLGYQSADSHARIAVSHNQGATWSNDQDVGQAFGIVNSTFPEVVAGDDNRAAYAFFGTTVPGNYTSFANYPQDAPWHLYIATTFDGGLSWTTVDATPNDPVQRGSICNLGTTACANTPDDRNLLDFMDETVDAQGRTLVGYPDGCVGTCVTNPSGAHPNSYTAAASIARQSGGKRLFAAFDPNPAEPVVPKAPRVDSVTQSSPGTTVHLAWSEPDNGGSPLTGYKVYRKSGAGGVYSVIATITLGCPDCKTTYDDSTATSTTTQYFYKVTATNAIGEGTNCSEFPVGSSGGSEEICVVPGLTKLMDAAGDTNATCVLGGVSTPAPPGADLLSFQIAQPYAPDGVIKLVFTLNTDNGQSPQATGSSWYVAMRTPDSSCATAPCYKAVHMTWKATSPTTPVFESYVPGSAALGGVDGRFVDTVIGPAEASSSYNAPYNKVVIVVKASDLGLNPGDLINGFVAGVTQTSDVGGIGAGATCMFDPMPDSLTYTGSHTVNANAVCGNNCPLAALSASPTSGNAPLTVNFNGASSSDPDTGDSVASYTFTFGDGSPPVTCPSDLSCTGTGTTSHTYNSPGDYNATLRVTDSRGLASCNTAQVVISVSGSPPPPQCVEDTDPQIAYDNGWHTVKASNASNGTYHLNTGKDVQHALTFTFNLQSTTGSLQYFYATSSKGGTAQVLIDGHAPVSTATVNYNGGSGAMRDPAFGVSVTYPIFGSGPHKFELVNLTGPAYVDEFCITNGGSSTMATAGPGTTMTSTSALALGQSLLQNVMVPSNALGFSVAAEANVNVPYTLVVIDPSGKVLGTVNSSSNGIASVTMPVSTSGLYVIKLVNVGVGPVNIWTAATPFVQR
jgi:hypothetical protein